MMYEPDIEKMAWSEQRSIDAPLYREQIAYLLRLKAAPRVVHVPPQLGEGRIRLALGAGLAILAAFEEPEHLAHADLVGRACQQIPTFGAAPRFHKTALFQTGQDQLEEFLRDLLPGGDLGYFYGLTRWLRA